MATNRIYAVFESYLREINRVLDWELPTDGPKTLNGLILEHLEMIPAPGTSLLIANYPVEITRTDNNAVQAARIHPQLATQTETPQSGMEAS